MVERQDIDALLISALYGELTPAEETRLAAHLESHPTDRTALADLTAARTVVRESRILQVQLDPPQSISALLLQEAARRAPKKPSEEREGWFARFARTFMAHPAMAAAAMLVLVVGVATLATRKGAEFAETSPVATTESAEGGEKATVTGQATNTMAPAAMGSGAVAPQAEPAMPQQADQYKVDLDSKFGVADGKAEEAKPTDGDALNFELASKSKQVALEQQKLQDQRLYQDEAKKEAGALDRGRGLELRKPEPAPKDLADDAPAPPKGGPVAKTPMRDENELDNSRRDPSIGAAGGAKNTTAPGMMPSGANTIAIDPVATTTTTTSSSSTTPRPNTGSAPKVAPPPVQAPTSPKVATKAATARDDRPAEKPRAEDKATTDPALVWARAQHAALVAQVRAGNCRNAASVAVNLSNRAPGYYAQNVASDRSVKECLAYINSEVTKDADLRAQRERAKRAEPSKRAIDATPRATTKPADAKTDSTK